MLKASLRRHLAFLLGEIADIDRCIADPIEADRTLARRAELLRSIPGIGDIAAAALVAELPERVTWAIVRWQDEIG